MGPETTPARAQQVQGHTPNGGYVKTPNTPTTGYRAADVSIGNGNEYDDLTPRTPRGGAAANTGSGRLPQQQQQQQRSASGGYGAAAGRSGGGYSDSAYSEPRRGKCAPLIAAIHWRDVFAICNFSVVALAVALTIYLSHEAGTPVAKNADDRRGIHYGYAALAALLGLSALTALVWTGALLFAHDRLFRWTRMATAFNGVAVFACAVAVATVIARRSDISESTDQVLERLVPICVLVVAAQLAAWWRTRDLVTDDDGAGNAQHPDEHSPIYEVPDD